MPKITLCHQQSTGELMLSTCESGELTGSTGELIQSIGELIQSTGESTGELISFPSMT